MAVDDLYTQVDCMILAGKLEVEAVFWELIYYLDSDTLIDFSDHLDKMLDLGLERDD